MTVHLLHYADLENAYDLPSHLGSFAGLLDHLREDTTLVVGAGDDTAPSALGLISESEQATHFMNEVEPDVETLGNHDFAYGADTLRQVISATPQTWVCANAFEDEAATEPFAAEQGLERWTAIRVGGERVGFFGVAHPATPDLTDGAGRVTFTDPVAAAEEAVAALRDEGVDYVVGVSHLGEDGPIAEAVDADAVFGGHIHESRVDRVDGTLLTRTAGGGKEILDVTLGADDEDEDAPENAAVRYDATTTPFQDADVVEDYRERLARTGLGETVATVEEPIERVAYRGESRIGNFVADAYRWAGDTDVAFVQSSVVREGPPLAGDVSMADLLSVVPFRTELVTGRVTGAELRDLLGYAAGAHLDLPDPSWWLAQVSGLTVVYDHETATVDEVTVGGEPLDDEATYTLTAQSFCFETDALFPTLGPDHRVDGIGPQYDAVLDYATANGVAPETEGRIARKNLSGSSQDE